MAALAIAANAQAATIKNGYADLSDWQPGDGRVALAGEWAVAWQSFRDPEALTTPDAVAALPERVKIPDYRTAQPGRPPGRDSHATYALVLDFGDRWATRGSAARPAVTVRAGNPMSAGELYLDGRRVSQSGTPAATADREAVNNGPLEATFTPPPSGRAVLVVHASNHALADIGLTGTVALNTSDQARRRDLADIGVKVPLLGGGLVMALVFVTLYFKSRQEITFALFAGEALGLTLNMALTSRLIERLGYTGDMSLLWRLEYAIGFMLVPFFYHFFQATFPQLYWRWPVKALWSAGGAAVAASALAPIWLLSELWNATLVVTAVVAAAVPAGALVGLVRRQPRTGFILVASGLFGATIIHDIAIYKDLVPHDVELRALGTIAFLTLLASFLGWRFQEAFAAADNLSARLSALNADLESRVAERTQELEAANDQLMTEKAQTESALAELKRANSRINESLAYARRMQRAALPGSDPASLGLAELAVWWEPRDEVGGDIYYLARRGHQTAILVMDCTGHGVPGALISFVALAATDRVIAQANDCSPERLLQALDREVRDQLHRGTSASEHDDGLEAGLAVLDSRRDRLAFAGVGIHLVAVGPDGPATYRGVKGGLGYRSLAAPQQLSPWAIERASRHSFALATDGLLEQPGGPQHLQLGRRRFAQMLSAALGQQARLDAALADVQQGFAGWQGEAARRDDVTVVAFRPAGA